MASSTPKSDSVRTKSATSPHIVANNSEQPVRTPTSLSSSEAATLMTAIARTPPQATTTAPATPGSSTSAVSYETLSLMTALSLTPTNTPRTARSVSTRSTSTDSTHTARSVTGPRVVRCADDASLFIPGATPAVTDARGDVDRFIQFYTDRMMDNADHIIQFFHGSYNEALKRAKDELKVLIVYLHDPNAPDARRFITESLNSAEFNEIIQANGAIVFGVAIDSPEGRSVSMQLRPRSYPFVGVIAQGMSGAMTLTLRVEGFIDAVGLSTNLRLTIADVNAQLNIVRQQRLQREADKLLREEQEREYRESAEKDRKKIQERRRLESEKQAAEDAEKQKAAMEASRREAIKAQRDSIKARLGEEPKSGDVVRVQVRFASGAKFDRRFLADDSLEELFNAILCQEACPDFFTLHSNFPRKEIFCAPEWYHNLRSAQLASQGEERTAFVAVQTFRAAGIDKSVALMVQDCMA